MSKEAPLVVVTGPDKRLKFGWWATRIQLWRVGIRAVYVTPKRPNLPSNASGVIISGGDDIDPQHYGVTGTAGVNYDAARDQLEIETIHHALDKQWPLLGICRGAQLLNVVQGGNLFTDIRPLRQRTPNRNSLFPIKCAELEPDSRLAGLLGDAPLPINSLHSQAVRRLGDGLEVAARDADGFVQAIESPDHPFLFGVQWHPEYLLWKSRHHRLFKAFAERVRVFTLKQDAGAAA
jgi:putative glutamine amidotransferase